MKSTFKIVVVVAAVAIALTPLPRSAVERVFARGIYPLVQPRLTALTNSTPFAWFDVMAVLVAGSLVVMWVRRLRHRNPGVVRTLAGLAFDTAAVAALLYLWFLGAWGLNYQRQPLTMQLDYEEARISRGALRELATRTIHSLNGLHKEAHAEGWPELHAIPSLLTPAFVRAQQELAMTWQAHPARPKRSMLNPYFTRVAIDGMTDPFFLETLANQSLLPFERMATVAHEWSHLAGYADESEASFVGWLVCMRASQSAQYSAWLALYGAVMSSLPRPDREELVPGLGPGPREDLRAINERIRRQMMPIANRAGYALYDRFLKANRIESGVRNYSEVVRLMLGTRFNQDGSPRLRGH